MTQIIFHSSALSHIAFSVLIGALLTAPPSLRAWLAVQQAYSPLGPAAKRRPLRFSTRSFVGILIFLFGCDGLSRIVSWAIPSATLVRYLNVTWPAACLAYVFYERFEPRASASHCRAVARRSNGLIHYIKDQSPLTPADIAFRLAILTGAAVLAFIAYKRPHNVVVRSAITLAVISRCCEPCSSISSLERTVRAMLVVEVLYFGAILAICLTGFGTELAEGMLTRSLAPAAASLSSDASAIMSSHLCNAAVFGGFAKLAVVAYRLDYRISRFGSTRPPAERPLMLSNMPVDAGTPVRVAQTLPAHTASFAKPYFYTVLALTVSSLLIIDRTFSDSALAKKIAIELVVAENILVLYAALLAIPLVAVGIAFVASIRDEWYVVWEYCEVWEGHRPAPVGGVGV